MSVTRVHKIEHGISLPDSSACELSLLQWHTPVPQPANAWKLCATVVEERRKTLQAIRNCITNPDEGAHQAEPLIIVAPEISLPLRLRDEIDALVNTVDRQIVVVAGFEHLIPSEYDQLLKQSASQALDEDWRVVDCDNTFVNCAGIWIRSPGEAPRFYLQRKAVKSEPEKNIQLLVTQQAQVFISTNQDAGHRLNFLPQICSDFTSPGRVSQLRRKIAEDIGPTQIDIAFVIQYNKNLDADEFWQGSKAYFEPAKKAAETDAGCIVHVNNAKSKSRRESHFGGSMFRFEWNRVRAGPSGGDPARNNYWHRDQGSFDHREIIIREDLPAIHRVRLRVPYMVPRIPGNGDPYPVGWDDDGSCLITNGLLNGNSTAAFTPVPPTTLFFKAEWGAPTQESVASKLVVLTGNPVPDEGVRRGCWAWLAGARDRWVQALGSNDASAIAAIDLLLCHNEFKSELKSREPNDWPGFVGDSLVRMLFAFSFIADALGGADGVTLCGGPSKLCHAVVGRQTGLCFLWGEGVLNPRSSIQDLYSRIDSNAVDTIGISSILVVTLGLAVDGGGEELKRLASIESERIDKPRGSEEEESFVEESIAAARSPSLSFLCESQIHSKFNDVTEFSALESAMRDVVRTCLN